MEKSNLEIAFEIVSKSKGPVKFADIWAEIVEQQGYSEEDAASHISKFYTNLSLDGRFVTLGENTWDLRVNHTFDKVHIDMNDVYAEEEDEEAEQDEEEKEYNKVFEDEKSDEDDDSLDEENEEDK